MYYLGLLVFVVILIRLCVKCRSTEVRSAWLLDMVFWSLVYFVYIYID
jgi:hypothetical protein